MFKRKTEYEKLNIELRNKGVPEYIFLNQTGDPIETLVNSKISAKPYVHILLKYFHKIKGIELEMVVRSLTEKGINQAVPYLLKIFREPEKFEFDNHNLWVVGMALYRIDDKSSYIDIIEICKNRKLGGSRQMLMGTLSKIKTDEVYQILLDCLTDESVRAHAIEALGKLGNLKAIDILQNLEVKKGLYEHKAKQTSLRKLHRRRGT